MIVYLKYVAGQVIDKNCEEFMESIELSDVGRELVS